jgi:hypothetical protein
MAVCRWFEGAFVFIGGTSDHESVKGVDVMTRMSEVLAGESGVVRLGEQLAVSVLSDLRVGGSPDILFDRF